MRQVAVREVQLDDVEARGFGPPRGRGELLGQFGDLGFGQRTRRGQVAEGVAGRADRVPAAVGCRHRLAAFPGRRRRRFAPGMRELHTGRGTLLVEEVVDASPCRDLVVVPQTGVLRADPAFRDHCGRLADDQPGATGGELAEVHQVPVVGQAVDRRVLAHRRYPRAVADDDVAQLDRFEKVAHNRDRHRGGTRYSDAQSHLIIWEPARTVHSPGRCCTRCSIMRAAEGSSG